MTNEVKNEYLRHRANVCDAALLEELCSMEGDEGRIAAAFSGELSFGTGGLRAIMHHNMLVFQCQLY